MESQTWQTTLTITTTKTDFPKLRAWLEEHAAPVPSTDADVIAKYLRCIIVAKCQEDAIPLHITLPRPNLEAVSTLEGLERMRVASASASSPYSDMVKRKDDEYFTFSPAWLLAICVILSAAQLLRTHCDTPSVMRYSLPDDQQPARHAVLPVTRNRPVVS